MALQVKKDPWVIVPYTLFTCGAIAALAFGKIKVDVFLAILGALNVASAFGLKKDDPPPSSPKGLAEPTLTFIGSDSDRPPPPARRVADEDLTPARTRSSFPGFGAMLLFAATAMTTSACGATATRAEARGAVLATAQAVKIGDETCAQYALARIDVELARRCEAVYTDARNLLLVASSGIDAWDEGKRGQVTCAVVHAAEQLAAIVNEFKVKKVAVPPLLEDALRLVGALGGCAS